MCNKPRDSCRVHIWRRRWRSVRWEAGIITFLTSPRAWADSSGRDSSGLALDTCCPGSSAGMLKSGLEHWNVVWLTQYQSISCVTHHVHLCAYVLSHVFSSYSFCSSYCYYMLWLFSIIIVIIIIIVFFFLLLLFLFCFFFFFSSFFLLLLLFLLCSSSSSFSYSYSSSSSSSYSYSSSSSYYYYSSCSSCSSSSSSSSFLACLKMCQKTPTRCLHFPHLPQVVAALEVKVDKLMIPRYSKWVSCKEPSTT